MTRVLVFLSDEWIAALDAAAAAHRGLAEATSDVALTVEHHVSGAPRGDVDYHVAFDHGTTRVRPGPADQPTVRFSQSYETAAAIASGEGSAQRAFMTGRLRIGGDLRVLLDHGDALAKLDDVFGAVRAETQIPAPPAA